MKNRAIQTSNITQRQKIESFLLENNIKSNYHVFGHAKPLYIYYFKSDGKTFKKLKKKVKI